MSSALRNTNLVFNSINVLIPVVLWGVFLWIWSLGQETREPLLVENGLVEMATVVGYVVFLILYVLLVGSKCTVFAPIMATMMMLRELDFHSNYTTMSLTKSRFFTSAEVPIYEKLIGAAVWVLVIYSAFRLGRYFIKPTITALKSGRAYAWAGVACVISAGIGKTMDGLGRKLASVGIYIGEDSKQYWGGFEEVIEMGIPLYMISAVLAYTMLTKLKTSVSA
jgi:hypothetical protein